MRGGVVKTSTSQPHLAEPQESTMSPWWMSYPSIWQILVNHLQLQSSMQSHHLADTATAASHDAAWYSAAPMQSCHITDTATAALHAATWYSPAPVMRVLRDPVNDTPHILVPMLEVQPPREADVSPSVHHNLCHCVKPTRDQFLTEAWDDDDDTTPFDKHFPTAPFDDDVWTEEQILDRCLGMHEKLDDLNNQCS